LSPLTETRALERLEQWEQFGDELYAAQCSLQQALIIAQRMHGKRSLVAKRVEKLSVVLDQERTALENVAAAEGYFSPPHMSPIRGAHRRTDCW
jgi:hypothetical protein